MAIIDDALTILYDLTDIFMIQYDPTLYSQYAVDFQRSLRWIEPQREAMMSNEIEITLVNKPLRSARGSTDPLADFFTPSNDFGLDTYTIHMKADSDAASNEVKRIDGSVRLTELDIRRAASAQGERQDRLKGEIVNIMRNGLMESMSWYQALHQFVPTTGIFATVNGDPKQNDDFFFADCGAHVAHTSMRAQVTGPIAAFSDGMLVDVVNPSGGADRANCGNLIVSGVNTVDNSVGLVGAADLAAAVDNDGIVLSDNYGKNFYGYGQWMNDPSSTVFSKDRSTTASFYLRPAQVDVGDKLLEMSHLNQLARAMGYVASAANSPGHVALTTPEIVDRFTGVVGQDAVLQYPTTAQGGDLVARYGWDGALYTHPMLGRVALNADLFHPVDTMNILRPTSWRYVHALTPGPVFQVGQVAGIWKNVTSSGRHSMFWESTMYQFLAYASHWPRGDGQLKDVKGEQT